MYCLPVKKSKGWFPFGICWSSTAKMCSVWERKARRASRVSRWINPSPMSFDVVVLLSHTDALQHSSLLQDVSVMDGLLIYTNPTAQEEQVVNQYLQMWDELIPFLLKKVARKGLSGTLLWRNIWFIYACLPHGHESEAKEFQSSEEPSSCFKLLYILDFSWEGDRRAEHLSWYHWYRKR